MRYIWRRNVCLSVPTEDKDEYWYGLTLVFSFQDQIEKLVLSRSQDCGGPLKVCVPMRRQSHACAKRGLESKVNNRAWLASTELIFLAGFRTNIA